MNATAAALDSDPALLSATQMTQAVRLTAASGISGTRLMENAGRPSRSRSSKLDQNRRQRSRHGH